MYVLGDREGHRGPSTHWGVCAVRRRVCLAGSAIPGIEAALETKGTASARTTPVFTWIPAAHAAAPVAGAGAGDPASSSHGDAEQESRAAVASELARTLLRDQVSPAGLGEGLAKLRQSAIQYIASHVRGVYASGVLAPPAVGLN